MVPIVSGSIDISIRDQACIETGSFSLAGNPATGLEPSYSEYRIIGLYEPILDAWDNTVMIARDTRLLSKAPSPEIRRVQLSGIRRAITGQIRS
jgi:hypothetical protein